VSIDVIDPPLVKQRVKTPRTIDTYDVLGIPVSVLNLQLAFDHILAWAADRTGRFVCVRDVHGVVRAIDDPKLMALHQRASMITPDGMPLVKVGRSRGKDVQQVCGSDLMLEVIEKGQTHGLKHYFYGGAEGVAELLASNLQQRYPRAQFVGWECPPFRELTEQEQNETITTIVESGADIVWVGLSTPKQEFWMDANVSRLPATLLGVGAAFDFHTGTVKRAPRWMQVIMLEWLYRLLKEPRRLWRRYLVLAPRFVYLMLREKKR